MGTSAELSPNPPPAILPEPASLQLEPLAEDLRALNAASSREFLALSQALQSIAGHCRKITEMSREVTGLAALGESERALDTLQKILADAAQLQALGSTSREKLHKILSALQSSRDPLNHLIKLPVKLNTVGMLSRIEGSRLEGAAVNVSGLTAEMSRLSESIAQQVATVSGESEKLAHLFVQSVRQMDEVEERERKQGADLVLQTQALLDSFQTRSRASNAAAVKIDEEYGGIRQSIDRIVTMLQSEDIGRQRVEHVQDVLRGAAVSAASDPKQEEVADLVALQHPQLIGTRDLLVNSITSILENLRSLRPRVEGLTAEVAALSLQTGEAGHSFADTIKSRMEGLCLIFDQYFGSARTVVSIVQTVLPSLSDMAGAVGEVEDIQASIRLMALNAEIKTAHLGNSGAAMGVLASELHKITEQSDGDTRSILDGLRLMEQVLKEMSGHDVPSGDSIMMSSGGAEVKEQVFGLVEAVLHASHEMAQRIAALQQVAGSLGAEIQNACEVAGRATGIGPGFDSVIERVKAAADHLDRLSARTGDRKGERAARLAAMYSMQSEREVHQSFFGKEGQESSAAGPAEKGNGAGDHDLGDNVELF